MCDAKVQPMSTEKITVPEARIKILEIISNLLYDLSDGEDLTQAESDEFREAMSDAAQIILEVIDCEVISVDGDRANVSLWIGDGAPPSMME